MDAPLSGPDSFIALIIIMPALGWAGACPNGKRDQGVGLSQRGIFRKDVPSNHDAGSGARAHSKETMMHFNQQPHRFYCGALLHARLLAICVVDADGHQTCRCSPDRQPWNSSRETRQDENQQLFIPAQRPALDCSGPSAAVLQPQEILNRRQRSKQRSEPDFSVFSVPSCSCFRNLRVARRN